MGTEKITYLGDGVYAKKGNGTVVLMANDHENPTDTIYLEPAVLSALIKFIEQE